MAACKDGSRGNYRTAAAQCIHSNHGLASLLLTRGSAGVRQNS